MRYVNTTNTENCNLSAPYRPNILIALETLLVHLELKKNYGGKE